MTKTWVRSQLSRYRTDPAYLLLLLLLIGGGAIMFGLLSEMPKLNERAGDLFVFELVLFVTFLLNILYCTTNIFLLFVPYFLFTKYVNPTILILFKIILAIGLSTLFLIVVLKRYCNLRVIENLFQSIYNRSRN